MSSAQVIQEQQEQEQPKPPSTLLDLPVEVVLEVLQRLAKQDYCSVRQLARTCRGLRKICKQFMETNPPEKFMAPHRVAGDSDSEDYEDYEDAYVHDPDDLEALADDMFDRLSYGSSYDSEEHNFVYGGHNSDEEEEEEEHEGDEPVPGR